MVADGRCVWLSKPAWEEARRKVKKNTTPRDAVVTGLGDLNCSKGTSSVTASIVRFVERETFFYKQTLFVSLVFVRFVPLYRSNALAVSGNWSILSHDKQGPIRYNRFLFLVPFQRNILLLNTPLNGMISWEKVSNRIHRNWTYCQCYLFHLYGGINYRCLSETILYETMYSGLPSFVMSFISERMRSLSAAKHDR